MPEPISPPHNGAVFLSYASQDAAAALRICEALRAVGVEVWFDQNELVGGDAWDQKIRGQIGSCALFVPLISANTQARLEGYFRLEWKLAAQRTHTMADEKTFLLPVVIDATRDAEAKVPVEFKTVQWTKLPGGETPPKFCARVKALLAGEVVPVSSSASPHHASGTPAPARKAGRRVPAAAWAIGAIVAIMSIVWVWQRRMEPASAPNAGAGTRPPAAEKSVASAAASSATEIARVRARINPASWQKGDFEAISPTIDRLIQTNPEDSDAWALRSIINSLQVLRVLDPGTKPLEAGQMAAEHALRLAPESPFANLALGMHRVALVSRGGDPRAAREPVDRAVAVLPADALTRHAGLSAVWLGYDFEATDRRAKAWLEVEPRAGYPAWILESKAVALRRPTEAIAWAEIAAADSGITGVRALTTLADVHYYLRADIAGARAAMDRLPSGSRFVPRAVFTRWLLAMAEQKWDEALQDLAQVPDAFLSDVAFVGPKALLVAMAHQRAGRNEAAAVQYREAERVLRERLAKDSDNEEERAALALTLARAGRPADSRSELALVEPLVKSRPPNVYRSKLVVPIAQTYGVLRDFSNMAIWLRKLFAEPSGIAFTPASFRLDPRFTGTVDAPEIQALLKEFASLDQPAAGAMTGLIDQKSVAVLAFANLSDDKGNEYFSDGISEELLNVLAKVPGLKVTARTSSFHFKGKDTPIPEIAKQLGVAYVIEGSVRKAGSQVRITAQLIKAMDGFHVWSDTFTRELKDVFAVQDEIAGLIAKNFQLTLRTETRARTVNPEAYELLLKGRAFLNRGVPAEYPQGIQFLKDSLVIEPDSAATWGRLSMGYMIAFAQNVPGWLPRDEILRQARQAANRAIELDAEQSLGHYARSLIAYLADWDWTQADASMQRVLALVPGDTEFLAMAASLDLTAGRVARALDAAHRAVLLDPLNFIPAYQLMKARWQSGDYAEMEKESKRVIAIHPGSPYGHTFLSYSYVLRGRADEAVQAAEHVTSESYRLTSLALAHYAQGKTTEAEAELERLKTQFGTTSAYQVAENYAFRKDRDRAFEWLEAAYRERDSGLTLITNDPFLASLRGDARWSVFMKKMKLPDGGTK